MHKTITSPQYSNVSSCFYVRHAIGSRNRRAGARRVNFRFPGCALPGPRACPRSWRTVTDSLDHLSVLVTDPRRLVTLVTRLCSERSLGTKPVLLEIQRKLIEPLLQGDYTYMTHTFVTFVYLISDLFNNTLTKCLKEDAQCPCPAPIYSKYNSPPRGSPQNIPEALVKEWDRYALQKIISIIVHIETFLSESELQLMLTNILQVGQTYPLNHWFCLWSSDRQLPSPWLQSHHLEQQGMEPWGMDLLSAEPQTWFILGHDLGLGRNH